MRRPKQVSISYPKRSPLGAHGPTFTVQVNIHNCSQARLNAKPTTTSATFTTALFAALEIATGTVTGVYKPPHRHQEFLAFIKHVARAYPDQELRLVMDR